MDAKTLSRIIITLIVTVIVSVSFILLLTKLEFENLSMDFSGVISNKKLPKTPGYHTEPIIEFKNRTMVHLGDFTTNIVAGGKSTKFLKTKVSVRTSDEDVSEEIKKRNVVIRDSVIKALSSKQFEQVATQRGKLLLKDEVSETLNGILSEGEVEEVFFTEFIIQ
ncbi:MAG: flagellar basal body-associated FliL family protein [Sulfurimonadaceae bacterium]|nr:flagellar basal body-associated FliL family protein [Sulfurimonadaceae bacterium]